MEAMFFLIREVYAQADAAFAESRHGEVRRQKMAEIAAECLEQFRQHSGIATVLTFAPTWKEQALSPMVKVQLKHILQEALANVQRHAAATRVAVSLAVEEKCTHICIEDDGCGFYLSRVLFQFLHPSYPRHGLPTMRDHARAVGGTFRIESSPGHGTRIVVRVPLNGSR
jgi:signal transduction histidine kinase